MTSDLGDSKKRERPTQIYSVSIVPQPVGINVKQALSPSILENYGNTFSIGRGYICN